MGDAPVHVVIKNYGIVTAYSDEELNVLMAVKRFLEDGEIESCRDLLSALELLQKRRNINLYSKLDDELYRVLSNNECPDIE